MKFQTTKKAVLDGFVRVYRAGYCELCYLLDGRRTYNPEDDDQKGE